MFHGLGCKVSEFIADKAASPFAQIGFIVACLTWWLVGLDINTLTMIISVMSITLTQMVLLSQDRITKVEHKKLDAIIAGTEADDSAAGGLEK